MKKKTIVVLLILLCVPLCAQQRAKDDIQIVELPEYEFIDYNLNKIQVPGRNTTRLGKFFHKLDTLLEIGEGSINILHIGGSHVQAGTFSHRMRQNLDFVNGNLQSPRGLIFPFSIAGTNNPSNFKVTSSGEWDAVRNVKKGRTMPLGMTGRAVFTQDSAAQVNIVLNPDGKQRWEFTRLRILGYVEDGSDKVMPVIFHKNDTIKGEFDADTKTYVFDFPEPNDSFTVGFIQADTIPSTFVITGFIPEKEAPGIVYHAIGVNGASVPSYLGSEFFEEELHLLKPDLVIFGIGINDAADKNFTEKNFYTNYKALIAKIERVNPDCAFVFITNNDSFKRISRRNYRPNTNALIARKVFYQLAREHKAGVWDLFSMMGGLGSMQKWQDAELAKTDKIHFTREGYQLLGDMLYNALIEYYKQYE